MAQNTRSVARIRDYLFDDEYPPEENEYNHNDEAHTGNSELQSEQFDDIFIKLFSNE